MKYTRLTKEQFEELRQEFINFLATQSITAEEWADIKANKPEVAEDELDVFSDLVWEGVLKQVTYLEHISPQQMHLFHLKDKDMQLIAVKLNIDTVDLTTHQGFEWLREHLLSDDVEFLTAKKVYSEDKALDKFKLIQQGGVITKGDLYEYFEKLVVK
jgi:cag pathogenicity island protein 24